MPQDVKDKVKETVRNHWLQRFEKPVPENSDRGFSNTTDELQRSNLTRKREADEDKEDALASKKEPVKASSESTQYVDVQNETDLSSSESESENENKVVVVLSDHDDDERKHSDSDELIVISENEFKNKRPIKKRKIIQVATKNETSIRKRPISSPVMLKPILSSPIKIFKTPVLPQKDSVLMSQLFPKTVYKTYQFSMQIDLDLLVPSIMKHSSEPPEIILITKDLFNYENYESRPEFKNNIKRVNLNYGQWVLHHSKMMINFHSTGMSTSKESQLFVEVVIMTCNLTFMEFGFLGSCYWKTPLLPLLGYDKNNLDKTKPQTFKEDLIEYLAEYKRSHMNDLIRLLKKYDFSSVKADFIGCVPGSGHDPKKFGFGKLDKVLSKYRSRSLPSQPENLKKPIQVLSHMSSIGGPYRTKPGPASILTHILCPIVSGLPYPLNPGKESVEKHKNDFAPIILFPTRSDISRGVGGPAINNNFIFHNVGTKGGAEQYDVLIKDKFYKRDFDNELQVNSQIMNNHTKVYMSSDDYSVVKDSKGQEKMNFHSINWVMMGSLNLSKSAWGQPGAKGSWRGNNWELGVILHPGQFKDEFPDNQVVFKPVWNQDQYDGDGQRLGASSDRQEIRDQPVNMPIRLPFRFPIIKCDPAKNESFNTLE